MWYVLQVAILLAVAATDVQWHWAEHNNMIIGLVGGALAWIATAALSWLIGCRLEEK
jgi:hypothetical protein